MTSPSKLAVALHRFSQAGALVVAAVGAAVLLGWIFDLPVLKSVAPGFSAMKVNTAVAFVAAGAALWLLRSSRAKAPTAGTVLAAVVMTLGGLTLAEYLFALDLGIDQLLVLSPTAPPIEPHPGRMAPPTALCLLFLGAALLALRPGRTRYRFARSYWLVLPALFVSTVAIVGYVYDVRSLYQVGTFSSMAAHTALSVFLLALAILAANTEGGIACVLVSDTDGGVVARRLLPTLPAAILLIGWLRLRGQEAGIFDVHLGLALAVVASITVLVLAISATALRLHGVDLERERAEEELRAMHQDLERRVVERTQELANSLAQVKQLSGLLPICAWCRKVRDDQDYWLSVEQFVAEKTDARFTHGICPDCVAKVEAQLRSRPDSPLEGTVTGT